MATLTTFAIVAGVAAVASAASSLVSGIQQAGVARYNQKLSQQNAASARAQAASEEEAFRRKAERMKGAQRAAIGASGITLEGSPLDIIDDTEVEIEREALGIRYAGAASGNRYDDEAAGFGYRARSAMMGGYIGAGTALLSGAGKIASNWPGGSSSTMTTGGRGMTRAETF